MSKTYQVNLDSIKSINDSRNIAICVAEQLYVRSHSLKILDVGCANGDLGKKIKQTCPESQIYGIETNAQSASDAAATQAYTDVISHLNSLSEDVKFDYIICLDVLEHIPHASEFLSSLRDKISDSGVIIISCPNYLHLSAKLNFLCNKIPLAETGIFDKTHRHLTSFETTCDILNIEKGEILDVTHTCRGVKIKNLSIKDLIVLIWNFYLLFAKHNFYYQNIYVITKVEKKSNLKLKLPNLNYFKIIVLLLKRSVHEGFK